MYRATVYWARGISAWHGTLDDRDITYQVVVPWLWLARWLACGQLGNRGALAYVIHEGDKLVEEFHPKEVAP